MPTRSARYRADAAAETVTFTFAQPLAARATPAAHRLHLTHQQIRPRLFFIDYPTDNAQSGLSSFPQPSDARRFPVLD